MRSAYKIFAYLLALEVVVQAAAVAYGVFGLGYWVDNDGGVLDKAAFESEDLSFSGLGGFILHGLNGMMVIPLVALVLLIVSFFAKVPRGVAVAGGLVVLVVLQVVLGLSGHALPLVGALHAANALLIFVGALHAGRLAGKAAPAAAEAKETASA